MSFRTSFHPFGRCIEDVSILLLFIPDKCSIDLVCSYIDKNVSKVHIFRDCIYIDITLRYENVNKSIPRLFVCVSVTVQVAVTSVQAQNEIQTVCIENKSA